MPTLKIEQFAMPLGPLRISWITQKDTKSKEGLISIDFRKAFDSVSRDFLFNTLAAFHFGPSFTRWIHTFYNNISSCVLNNGYSTAPFEVQRGVRQGDPLSSSLFIIVLEILAISIRSCKSIQGIKVDGKEIKLGLFADDLTAFLLNDLSLLKFLELLESFGDCSGLKINNDGDRDSQR